MTRIYKYIYLIINMLKIYLKIQFYGLKNVNLFIIYFQQLDSEEYSRL
jgi:hypothetical protein